MAKEYRKDEVTFIRKHGKIIPIKRKHPKKKGLSRKEREAAKVAASGVGVAVGGAVAHRAITKQAIKKLHKGEKAFTLSRRAVFSAAGRSERLARTAARLAKTSARLTKFARFTRLGSLAAAAGLIETGFEQAFIHKGKEETAKHFAINVSSSVAAGAFLIAGGKFGLRRGAKEGFKKLKQAFNKMPKKLPKQRELKF
jgi:hypothetical protein